MMNRQQFLDSIQNHCREIMRDAHQYAGSDFPDERLTDSPPTVVDRNRDRGSEIVRGINSALTVAGALAGSVNQWKAIIDSMKR